MERMKDHPNTTWGGAEASDTLHIVLLYEATLIPSIHSYFLHHPTPDANLNTVAFVSGECRSVWRIGM